MQYWALNYANNYANYLIFRTKFDILILLLTLKFQVQRVPVHAKFVNQITWIPNLTEFGSEKLRSIFRL